MFILTLHDRNGVELKLGDLVKISNGRRFTFFSEVKWLEKEQVIAPFNTFSFHSFEKVDKIPEKAVKRIVEGDYDCWYLYDEDAEDDSYADQARSYLKSWRDLEMLIESRAYRIKPILGQQKLF